MRLSEKKRPEKDNELGMVGFDGQPPNDGKMHIMNAGSNPTPDPVCMDAAGSDGCSGIPDPEDEYHILPVFQEDENGGNNGGTDNAGSSDKAGFSFSDDNVKYAAGALLLIGAGFYAANKVA